MRILEIKNSQAIIQVDFVELDTMVNDYLDKQYAIGYDEGFNDGMALNNANMDADHSNGE